MAKLLVIDKCRFQGESKSALSRFVKVHQVVVPHVLAVECLVSDDCSGRKQAKNPIGLLHRLEDVVKAVHISDVHLRRYAGRRRQTGVQ